MVRAHRSVVRLAHLTACLRNEGHQLACHPALGAAGRVLGQHRRDEVHVEIDLAILLLVPPPVPRRRRPALLQDAHLEVDEDHGYRSAALAGDGRLRVDQPWWAGFAAPVFGSTGQHPARSPARHLATWLAAVAASPPRTIVAEFAATPTLAAVSARTSTRPAARSARTACARPAAAIPPALAATARVKSVPLLALWSGHQVHGVVKLAALLRTARSVLALKDAHEAHLSRPVADHVERFHQTGKPVALDLQLRRHGFGLGPGAQVGSEGRRLFLARARVFTSRHGLLGRQSGFGDHTVPRHGIGVSRDGRVA